MRIEIIESARRHGISDAEIRCTIEYPILAVPIRSRVYPDARPILYVGRFDSNEPLLEVIAETVGDMVFHAMLLRPTTVVSAEIENHVDHDDIATNQRR